MFEIIFTTVYLLITIGAAIAVVATLGFAMHGERLWGTKFVPAIVPLITLGIAVSTLMSGRNLLFAEKQVSLLSLALGEGTKIMQLITLAILCIAMAKLIGAFVQRQSMPAAPGTPLFVALMVYLLANNFLPSAFGTVPTFVHTMFYPVLIFSAAWAARRESPEATIIAAKLALYVLMTGSLLTALIEPSIAIQPNYESLIPGLKIRFWGLTAHANVIGPLALITLLLEYLHPTRSLWLRALLMLATGLVFVLAQSKTVWIVLPIVLAILAWYRWVKGHNQRASIVAALVFIGAASALLSALMLLDVGAMWARFSDSRLGASLTTFTGRTGIWEVALREWQRNPIFGYGPEIWGPRFRAEYGVPHAFSAHNQFMQTLSAAGTLGFVALLAYMGYMIRAALRAAASTKGVSVALLSMVLIRSLSETPLSMTGLIDGNALIHFLFFVIILRAPDSRQARHASRQALTTPATRLAHPATRSPQPLARWLQWPSRVE